jgi:hypothetical protein
MPEMREATMTGRIATPDTIALNITAWELAKLMLLEIRYTAEALDAMPQQDRELIEWNSKPEDTP